MVALKYVHKSFTIFLLRSGHSIPSPWILSGLRDSIITNTIQQKCCFVNSKGAFTFVTGTLVLGIVSCHVRNPTMLRPPGYEEAKAMLKRPCIGVLVASATEIPVDSQHQVPAPRVSHLGCPAQVNLDNFSPTYLWCNHMGDPSENWPAKPFQNFWPTKSWAK